MKIAIAGGCFTEQHNIPKDRLYHSTLQGLFKQDNKDIEIRTIRYERISKCAEKIVQLKSEYDFDLLLFHLRAEPLMRMSKLYYKYLNDAGELKHALNLPYFYMIYPEKFDVRLHTDRMIGNPMNPNESRFYHSLREANYMLGSWVGNKKYALEMLKNTILEIRDFCLVHKVKLLLLGPVLRPFSRFENSLSMEINDLFENLTRAESIKYLSLLKQATKNNESMFFENGIHVSQAGHDEIASMIYSALTAT